MSRKGANPWILGIGLGTTALLFALFWVSFGNNPHAVPSVLENSPAPDFALSTLDGEPVRLDALKGRPVVVNFWSTWCGPCKHEHPYLQRAATANPDVTFVGVIYNDEPRACSRYLDRVGTTYDHLVDPNGRTAIAYGVAGVPETFFIDAEGTLRIKHTGPLNGPMIDQYLRKIRGGT